MFIPVKIIDAQGTVIGQYDGSTTEFNKSEMSEYIENIRAWAADNLGIDIPDADSSLAMNF